MHSLHSIAQLVATPAVQTGLSQQQLHSQTLICHHDFSAPTFVKAFVSAGTAVLFYLDAAGAVVLPGHRPAAAVSLQLTWRKECPVISPIFMEETLKVQRHFFPLCRSFLVLTQKPLSWSAGCVRAVLVDHRILSALLLFTCFMPHFQQRKTLIWLKGRKM